MTGVSAPKIEIKFSNLRVPLCLLRLGTQVANPSLFPPKLGDCVITVNYCIIEFPQDLLLYALLFSKQQISYDLAN